MFLPPFNIYDTNYEIVRQANFIRFRSYNYTLNEHINTFSPKRVSVTADYVLKYSNKEDANSLIKADILLYYISLKYHTEELLDSEWYPELSVFNRTREILPFMVSKSYFDQAKVLFGVKTIEEYKQFLMNVSDSADRAGIFRIPNIKVGLMYDTVGSKE